ncbi:MAG: YigZ family protein [Proteobacteria bacterium]|nr:MAG: YigZ family protein [Pseudomonadota bacterium]
MSSRILLKVHRTELVEKNSRFIGIGCISQSLIEFKHHKEALEKEFSDANHLTFAYRILDSDSQSLSMQTRFSDDGEPSGTAGKPILMHLEGNDLINVTLFVVRYFGGIKLGAGGLVKAYGNTARQLIQEAEWGPFVVYREQWLSIPYSEQNRMEYLTKKYRVEIIDRQFSEHVLFLVKLSTDDWQAFSEAMPTSWTLVKSL